MDPWPSSPGTKPTWSLVTLRPVHRYSGPPTWALWYRYPTAPRKQGFSRQSDPWGRKGATVPTILTASHPSTTPQGWATRGSKMCSASWPPLRSWTPSFPGCCSNWLPSPGPLYKTPEPYDIGTPLSPEKRVFPGKWPPWGRKGATMPTTPDASGWATHRSNGFFQLTASPFLDPVSRKQGFSRGAGPLAF